MFTNDDHKFLGSINVAARDIQGSWCVVTRDTATGRELSRTMPMSLADAEGIVNQEPFPDVDQHRQVEAVFPRQGTAFTQALESSTRAAQRLEVERNAALAENAVLKRQLRAWQNFRLEYAAAGGFWLGICFTDIGAWRWLTVVLCVLCLWKACVGFLLVPRRSQDV